MMKRFLLLAVMTLSLIGCENLYLEEINAIHKEMDVLRELIDRANSNVDAMQVVVSALQANDYVTGVTPIMENGVVTGYSIAFSKSGTANIYHGQDGKDGKEGYTPQISIKKDTDGIYYWILDGKWMLDDTGNKVRAIGMDGHIGQDGITPKLKIENGYWYISYDNGATWSSKTLGQATGDKGTDGDSFFKDVVVSDHEVKFITQDGEEFIVPRNRKVKLILDAQDGETGILPGKEIVVNYTVENATNETFVTASSNGVYTVRVVAQSKSQGKIYIKAPYQYSDGYINVMVTDGESFSLIKVINFYEEQMSFTNGLEYSVSAKGGTLSIPFKTNFDCNFVVSSSASNWLSVTSANTKAAMKNGTLTLNIAANNVESSRSGKISVVPSNSTGDIYEEIVINQASAVFSVEKSKYSAHIDGETITTLVSSSRGLTIKVPSDASSWLTSKVTDLGNDSYRVTTVVQKNSTQSIRSAMVELYSEDGSALLGQIEYVQAFAVEDELSCMIFIARANMANDFTIDFTLVKGKGGTDCYVDWGDGEIERYQIPKGTQSTSSLTASHSYDISIPTDVTIKISGTMPGFKSSPYIKEVKQWGQTGLLSLDFSANTLLHTICDDKHASFHNLTSISFSGCTGLKSIPSDLLAYATSLTGLSFSGCTSLTSIPDDLFKNCANVESLSSVFSGCKRLASIPESLFKGCTSLTSIRNIFSGCTGITNIPEDLFKNCDHIEDFSGIFSDCSNLSSIPEKLFYNCTKASKFDNVFSNCSNITSLPQTLFSTCINATSFDYTFNECTGLTSIPKDLFKNCVKTISFSSVFQECTGLTSIPETLFENCTNVESFSGTFYGCSRLTSVPEDLFKNCANVVDFVGTFHGCDLLKKIPENLFKHCHKVTNVCHVFGYCTGLTSIPTGLFDYNRRIADFSGAFNGCRNLKGESPYTVINDVKYHLYERHKNPDEFVNPTSYEDCFTNCTGLSDFSRLKSMRWGMEH